MSHKITAYISNFNTVLYSQKLHSLQKTPVMWMNIRVRAVFTAHNCLFLARKTVRACLVSENLFPNVTDCLKIES